ncbi:MAG: c-type cytochrome [Blastocatellia bacterium]|nr:c-type cytochrome [Blastocatellia bacterium]
MLQHILKRILVSAALILAGLLFLSGRPGNPIRAAQDQAAAEPTMEQKYKNIQALKGLPASQMRPMMNYISATLGMACADCHVRTGDAFEFEKDDNNHKKIARKMILMTMDLNKQHFNGRTQVTCQTCHQGHDHPLSVPTLPSAPPKPAGTMPSPLPTAPEILAKYTQAIGGKEALEKIKSRVIKGASVAGNGQSFPLEISVLGPDKYAMSVALPQGASAQKLNGAQGWLKNSREDRAMDAVDLARARSLAMSLDPVLIRDPNARVSFAGFEKIGDRETVILRTALADKRRVRFFFDRETGLLVRRIITTETVIGVDPEQTDYEDYREVDGVKVPFTIRTSYLDRNYSSLRKFTEIRHNAKVDEALFALPAAK